MEVYKLNVYALATLVLVGTSVPYVSSGLQLQMTPIQAIDGIVDWVNAGVDSFGPFAAGAQQAQWADVALDWINSILDGSPSPSSGSNTGEAFPSA
jgi:hypothetical protein